MRRFSLASLAAAALIAAIPSGASAATQIGETFTPETGCGAGADLTRLQSVSPGNQYAAPFNGVITRWSFEAAATPPDLRFKVGRAAPGADLTMDADFTIVGESVIETDLTADALNSFFTQIPVQAGDVIGFYNATTTGFCRRPRDDYVSHQHPEDVHPGDTETFFFVDNTQNDVSALLEPDCDKDGLGDETQDTNLPTPPCPTQLTCKGQLLTIVGTNGPDEIVGTANRDVIGALDGNDKVRGLGGKDRICGGKNKDTLKGGKGKDKLFGQKGRDRLRGGGARDVCKGGKGDDSASKCEVEKSI